jgi:HK97 family phage major capsid protein
MTSVDYRYRAGNIVDEARKKFEDAQKRDGGPTVEERTAFERAMDDAEKDLETAKAMESAERMSTELDQPMPRISRPLDVVTSNERALEVRDAPRQRGAFRHWLRTGEVRQELRGDQARLAEYRDTIVGTDSKGGYLVTPTQISDEVVKQVNDFTFIRALARIIRVTDAKALGIRQITTRMADANWTTEVQAVTEDTTMALGRRDLTPNLLSKLSKVSMRTLLLSSDAEDLVFSELAYKFAITEEKAYLTGDGNGKPLGVFTADNNGVPTSRDVTASGTTSFNADDLVNAKFSLKQGYQQDPSCRWILHRDAVKMARKLKDLNDQYIWQPGLAVGAPNTILDVPYCMSEYAPNTFTTGLYVGIIGAFRYYWIAEVVDLVIQRLVELYAGTNEVGFIGRRWIDGSPALGEAFARIKLA